MVAARDQTFIKFEENDQFHMFCLLKSPNFACLSQMGTSLDFQSDLSGLGQGHLDWDLFKLK